MDLNKLSMADKIMFGTGIVFILTTFLEWFSVSVLGVATVGANAWDLGFLWGPLPVILVIALLTWVGLQTFSEIKLPPEIRELYLAGGLAVLALPLLKLIAGTEGWSRSFGLFLAILAAAAFAFGCVQKFLSKGGDLDDVKARLQAKGQGLADSLKDAGRDQSKDKNPFDN